MENTTTDGLAERGTKVAHDVKGQALALLDRGKKRSETLVHMRRRRELLRDLGELTYAAHVGGDEKIDAPKREALLAELDELDPVEIEATPT